MRKIMVLQHVAYEPLGTLNPMLKAAGFRIRYINFGRDPDAQPSLEGYSGLVVLGGPMGVYEMDKHRHIRTELALIEEALRRDIPVLGICLGSQLLAHALGSKIRVAKSVEMGWHEVHLTESGRSDELFRAWNGTERVFQMHQDTFDTPRDSHHLGWSEICAGQAFRYGEKAYGLQFHLEVDKAMIHRWLKVSSNQTMIEAAGGKPTVETIESETVQHIQRSLDLSRMTFEKFISIFQLPDRPELLGSGHGKSRKGY